MADGCYHVPVLLKESVDGLNIGKGGVFVDVTFGGGGHSREILSRLDGGHLYSFDQDAEAEQNIVGSEAFTFVRSNFRYAVSIGVVPSTRKGCSSFINTLRRE